MTTTEILIPLNKLIPSPKNVRGKGKDDAIGELAASIAAIGLRQNLNVGPSGDGERYEVVAGGRRLRALKLLAKAKTIAKDFPVRCVVLSAEDNAAEISLAENTVRTAMDPMDEFEAFDALVNGETPIGIEAVASRFGVTPLYVQRRLKLAQVSPKLRGLYRKGSATLDQLMAFTITDDHAAQETVWKELPEWERTASGIRRALTKETVPLSDKFAKFVGEQDYLDAGGGIIRDLFDEDGSRAYLTDRILLLKLAGDKLDAIKDEVLAEGWKWAKIEITPDHDTRYDWIEPLANVDADDETERFAPEDMARAGVRVRVVHDGAVMIDRGMVHPDDMAPAEGGGEAEVTQLTKAKPSPGPFSAVLVEDLTAHRTAALRIVLARNPAVALAATVHALALPLLYRRDDQHHDAESCLSLRASSENLEPHTAGTEECAAHQALAEEADYWGDLLPGRAEDLFAWCLKQPQDLLLDLLAYVAALSVNAVKGKHERADSSRLAHSHALAGAMGFDMAEHWTPTVDGFFGRVSKAGLIEIVTQAKAPMQVSIAALKKTEAARYVHKAMLGNRWLPEPLTAQAVPSPAPLEAQAA